MRRLLKSPALHFLLIGGLIFALHRAWTVRSMPSVKEELVISKEQIQQIEKDIFAQTELRATPAQIQAEIQKAIDDEMLYRQALALHLDRNNPSIRHRLIQLARFVSEDPQASDAVHYQKALDLGLDRSDLVIRRHLISMMRLVAQKVPTPRMPSRVSEDELQKYFEQHSQSFLKPRQMKLTQIYFSRDKRGSQGEVQAKVLLKQLQKDEKLPGEILGLGDAFLEGNRFSWLDDAAFKRLFGPNFTKNLGELESGKWEGPVLSSYGWHLIFVEATRPAEVPPLRNVANQVRSAILKEREQQRLFDTLQQLRSRYSIRVEDGASHANDPT